MFEINKRAMHKHALLFLLAKIVWTKWIYDNQGSESYRGR